MRTLTVSKHIGRSILGTAYLSPKFQSVQVGKCVPSIHAGEDSRILANCGFLDASIPIEVNLLNSRPIQSSLLQRRLEFSVVGATQDSATFVSHHPIVGYVPPEVFTEPNSVAIGALSESGPVAREVAEIRAKSRALARVEDRKWSELRRKKHFVGDSTFWTRMKEDRSLYSRLVSELLAHGSPFGLSLLSPPVPVLQRRFPNSADLQGALNEACSQIVKPDRDPIMETGLLYSFHLEANVFQERETYRRALDVCAAQLKQFENRFSGIHLAFVGLDRISQIGGMRVQAAVDLIDELVAIADQWGMFVWVTGAGPVGAFTLDRGVAFASYALTGSMRLEYPVYRYDKDNPPDPRALWERRFGQTLSGPWSLSLRSRQDMEDKDWNVEKNGYSPQTVPMTLRNSPDNYRVEFGKVNNIGVLEKLNQERDRELVVNGNPSPGSDAVGRSLDAKVRVWSR